LNHDGFSFAVGLDQSSFTKKNVLLFRSVERFDPREARWSQVPAMGCKRGSLSAAILNGKL
jgi:hypothetical protein